MKKLITILLMLFITNVCIATERKNMYKDYKVLKCDDKNNVCIVRYKYFYYGLFDKDCNTIIPVEYTDIRLFSKEDTNYLLQKKADNGDIVYGIANPQGKIIIEPVYHHIENGTITGTYRIQSNWDFKFGLADKNSGKIILEPKYGSIIKLRNNHLWVESENAHNEGIVNDKYKLIIPTEYRQINLMNGDKYYRVNKFKGSDVVYGIIDTEGKFVLPLEYSWIDEAGKTDAEGNPLFDYTVVKNEKNYIFNSLTGKLK